MNTLRKKIEEKLVTIVEWIKNIFHCQTWHVEAGFIFAVLAAVAIGRLIVTGHGWIEWIGVFAVHFTARHASVANRLEEKEAHRVKTGGQAEVECYRHLTRYFYFKEALWCTYFILVGAYSALVGVGVFLLYGWWRTTWRTYHPFA